METLDQILNGDLPGAKCVIQIAGDDVIKWANAFKEQKPVANEKEEPERYSTRVETAKRLRITLPTLNKYDKYGLIKSVRIGGRVLYPESEILKALKDRRA